MSDAQINSINPDGASNVNNWNFHKIQPVPKPDAPKQSFEQSLKEAQQSPAPPVEGEKSQWPQIKARERFPSRSVEIERNPRTGVTEEQTSPEERAWPAPYNPSNYRTKSVKEFRQMQTDFARRIPKNEENNPDLAPSQKNMSQMTLYKQDQFLANPGGDYYVLQPDGSTKYEPDYDHTDFMSRVGKDVQDVAANIKNAFANMTDGAKFSYVDAEGKIQTAQKTGLLKTLGNFVKNVFDALSFGKNETENAPESALQKAGYAGKKIFIDGLVKNIILGVPQAMLNTGENLLSATLNAMEIVPDATIGTTDLGRKVTTTVFDNAQVTLNYITDVMPTGEAWLRVHAAGSEDDGFKLPYLYNLKTPQQGLEDMRWSTVRNTQFRKVIETVGTIFSDMLTWHGLPLVSLAPEIQTGAEQQPSQDQQQNLSQ